MDKRSFISVLLCLAVFMMVFVGCNFINKEKPTDNNPDTSDKGTLESQSASPSDNEDLTPVYTLEALKIGGTDISEFVIVYPVSFTREQCFEDMSIAAGILVDEIEKITGSKIQAVPDTEQPTKNEIILGIAIRSECVRYYNESTKLETDKFCVMYSSGKLLLGADCLSGVMDACDVFLDYVKEEISNGKTVLDIGNGFDKSGESHITRIVCVGDSITEGVGAEDEISQSYPAQLQKALGYEYDVVNFGKGGATMCSYSEALYLARSYIEKSGYYDDLISIAPYTDVVLIMLGSNDGSGSEQITNLLQNNYNAFKTDYTVNLTKMVNDLREVNKNIKIMLLSTTKTYSSTVRENNINTYVRPLQKQLCESLNLDFYDMFTFSYTKMSAFDFGDGLHPTSAGYIKMGTEMERVLSKQYQFS